MRYVEEDFFDSRDELVRLEDFHGRSNFNIYINS